jgi:hypothetical protein
VQRSVLATCFLGKLGQRHVEAKWEDVSSWRTAGVIREW